jgi:hypothetical protein
VIGKLALVGIALLSGGFVRSQSEAFKTWMTRMRGLELRMWEILPPRRDSPRRYENISDGEVREVQSVMAQLAPLAIVNIGTVATGCPCEEGPTCTDQVWVVGYRPEKMTEVLLSRVSDHWTIGPVQRLWWEYGDLEARWADYRPSEFLRAKYSVLQRLPSCPK